MRAKRRRAEYQRIMPEVERLVVPTCRAITGDRPSARARADMRALARCEARRGWPLPSGWWQGATRWPAWNVAVRASRPKAGRALHCGEIYCPCRRRFFRRRALMANPLRSRGTPRDTVPSLTTRPRTTRDTRRACPHQQMAASAHPAAVRATTQDSLLTSSALGVGGHDHAITHAEPAFLNALDNTLRRSERADAASRTPWG